MLHVADPVQGPSKESTMGPSAIGAPTMGLVGPCAMHTPHKLQFATAPCFPTAQTWRPHPMDTILKQHARWHSSWGASCSRYFESAITCGRGRLRDDEWNNHQIGEHTNKEGNNRGIRTGSKVSVTRVTWSIHFTIWNTTTTHGHVIATSARSTPMTPIAPHRLAGQRLN